MNFVLKNSLKRNKEVGINLNAYQLLSSSMKWSAGDSWPEPDLPNSASYVVNMFLWNRFVLSSYKVSVLGVIFLWLNSSLKLMHCWQFLIYFHINIIFRNQLNLNSAHVTSTAKSRKARITSSILSLPVRPGWNVILYHFYGIAT